MHSILTRAVLIGLALPLLPLSAQQKPAAPVAESEEEADELVLLSPFEVPSSAGSYDATNTNSVTGTNLPLDKTPLSAAIFNQNIISELGRNDLGSLLSDFGGFGAPLLAAGDEGQRGFQEGDGVDYKTMSSRGLTISNPRRDGFLRSDTSLMDAFDVESVEALRGSNSLLFGSGDAGGVINVVSKRAILNRTSVRFLAKWDSEDSRRFSQDINVGLRHAAIRINHVWDETRTYRRLLGFDQNGYQIAATIRPARWITAYGEYRDFKRDHIRSGDAILRMPAGFVLSNGESMDGRSARYITGLGGSALIGNFIDYTSQDSLSGAYLRHYYEGVIQSATVEVNPARDLYFQLKYAQDERTNSNLAPLGGAQQLFFHPDAAGNLYRDANGNRGWAANTSPTGNPNIVGARGFKLTGTYNRDLGKWGDHRLNAFYSEQELWTITKPYRFVEVDAAGNPIRNSALITNGVSGQTTMPNVWVPAYAEDILGYDWPTEYIIHPNGRRYKFAPLISPGLVAPTAGNPQGLSGPVDPITGATTVTSYRHQDTKETSYAASLFSEYWQGRINTMVGVRLEEASFKNRHFGTKRGPLDYDSTTLGVVFDTPIKGVRGYASYATNARITEDVRTIYDEPLPLGEGVSREAGIKFSMWDHKISGNVAYYLSEAKDLAANLSTDERNDIDPSGINGRNGGSGYSFDRESSGVEVALSIRPIKPWTIRLNFAQAGGKEKSDVALPVLYNDEFNTVTIGGVTYVGVLGANGQITPLTNGGGQVTVASLTNPASSNFAILDPQSGQIVNASAIGLTTVGVGTNRSGLPISQHQLGFVPPTSPIIVRAAGERSTGYPEHAFSLINRYQFDRGFLKGSAVGLTTIYQDGIRGYAYTDAAAGGVRRVFYYPDRFENGAFASYTFRLGKGRNRARATVQLNVSNILDKQEGVALPRATDGTTRYFAYQYSPRKFVLSANVAF